ncbi:sigma-70 factor domain-containing protein, partial [Blastococcus sp. TF02-09]|uniref:sigma-70 factor domain-containing protein n=1 Tax=Blastococcus sp. TF02-09 TaxID=2250576 RepID=UPI0032AF0969
MVRFFSKAPAWATKGAMVTGENAVGRLRRLRQAIDKNGWRRPNQQRSDGRSDRPNADAHTQSAENFEEAPTPTPHDRQPSTADDPPAIEYLGRAASDEEREVEVTASRATEPTDDLPDGKPILGALRESALRQWRADGQHGMVHAAESADRVLIGIAAAQQAVYEGNQVVVITPSAGAQARWLARVFELLPEIDVGQLGAGHTDELDDCHVLVAISPALLSATLELRVGDLVITDDWDKYNADPAVRTLIQAFDKRLILTSTPPSRLDPSTITPSSTKAHVTGWDSPTQVPLPPRCTTTEIPSVRSADGATSPSGEPANALGRDVAALLPPVTGVASTVVHPPKSRGDDDESVVTATSPVAVVDVTTTVQKLGEPLADRLRAIVETPDQGQRAQEAADLRWEAEEEEFQALRQTRKDAELTNSADTVRIYLKQIGKVALLNAEEEVDLAKRIEAGLYGSERLRQVEEEGIK